MALEFLVEITCSNDDKYILEAFANEEHEAAETAIADLQARLAALSLDIPKANTTVLVVPAGVLKTSPFEVGPATWGEW